MLTTQPADLVTQSGHALPDYGAASQYETRREAEMNIVQDAVHGAPTAENLDRLIEMGREHVAALRQLVLVAMAMRREVRHEEAR